MTTGAVYGASTPESAQDADGQLSELEELTVKIDAMAPTVTANGANGVLTLTASDSLSGIGSVEYSTDGAA